MPEFEDLEGDVIARTREIARWRETGDPTHAAEWSDPGIDSAYKEVRDLVLRGLLP